MAKKKPLSLADLSPEQLQKLLLLLNDSNSPTEVSEDDIIVQKIKSPKNAVKGVWRGSAPLGRNLAPLSPPIMITNKEDLVEKERCRRKVVKKDHRESPKLIKCDECNFRGPETLLSSGKGPHLCNECLMKKIS